MGGQQAAPQIVGDSELQRLGYGVVRVDATLVQRAPEVEAAIRQTLERRA